MRSPRADPGWAAVAAAAVLLLLGAVLPLWKMTLYAPQYPRGLRLVIDGRGAGGDVDELNALNHYIGMAEIRTEAIPEARAFFPAVALLTLGILLLPLVRWRALAWLVAAGIWGLALAFLALLQWRLRQFGHSLDPAAAFRLPAFTPLVIGPTSVMNFNVTALPGAGLVALVLAALVVTVGLRLRGGRRPGRQAGVALVAGIAALAALLSLSAPGAAAVPGFDLAAAVASAAPGAVIEVPPGRYQGPLVLSRPVTLKGVGRPVVDAGGRGDVVVIAGDDVRLEGFVVRGSALAYSREAAGVVIRGARAVVRDTRIEDVLFGIYLTGATDAVIEDNTIVTADLPEERRGHAVYLWKVERARIVGNRILRGKDGIYISFSDGNLVERNEVTGCRYGIHYMYSNANTFRANVFRGNATGAAVMYSTDVALLDNTFEGSRAAASGVGLLFKDVDRLTVRGNRIVRNHTGLEFDSAPTSPDGWVRVERNLVAFNDVGMSLMSTAAITATENAFVENLRTVLPRGMLRPGVNRWAVGGRGNFWSDYTGFDASGDGIGDVPYRRTDLLEDLASRVPVLQAFLHTPAHLALEAGARLVPLIRGIAVVDDPAPLMRMPATAAVPAPAPGGVGMAWVGLALLAPGAAWIAARRPRPRRA